MGQDHRDRTRRAQEIDVSTPGPGGPPPPEQDPDRPGGWRQRPPAGWGPQPGQPSWGGSDNVTQPQDYGRPPLGQPPFGQPPFGQSPVGQPPFGQSPSGEPQRAGRPRKWLPIIGGVVGLIVVLNLVRGFASGDPEVGDCVQDSGSSGFDTVDCDSDDAQFRILGTDEDMTGAEFDATDPNELCGDFADATSVFWYGSDNDSDGTIYCATDV
jgi:hypothetical protein